MNIPFTVYEDRNIYILTDEICNRCPLYANYYNFPTHVFIIKFINTESDKNITTFNGYEHLCRKCAYNASNDGLIIHIIKFEFPENHISVNIKSTNIFFSYNICNTCKKYTEYINIDVDTNLFVFTGYFCSRCSNDTKYSMN